MANDFPFPTQSMDEVPDATSTAGAKVFGVDNTGKTVNFRMQDMLRSEKGIAYPDTDPDVDPVTELPIDHFAGETWLVDTGSYGETFTGFGNLEVPVKVGDLFVNNARFVYNDGAWELQKELLEITGVPSIQTEDVVYSENLQNPASIYDPDADQKTWINTSGNYVKFSGSETGIVYFKNGVAGDVVTIGGWHHPDFSGSKPLCYRFDDATGTKISSGTFPATEAPFTLTFPVGATSLKYGVYRSSAPKAYSQVMLLAGDRTSDYPSYVAYGPISEDARVKTINDVPIQASFIKTGKVFNEGTESNNVVTHGQLNAKEFVDTSDIEGMSLLAANTEDIESINLQNPVNLLADTYIQTGAASYGNKISLSGATTRFMAVSDAELYTIGGAVWDPSIEWCLRYEDAEGNKLGYLLLNKTAPTLIDPPDGCVKIYYPFTRSGFSINTSEVMVLAGDRTSDFPAFEPFFDPKTIITGLSINGTQVEFDNAIAEDSTIITNAKTSDKIAYGHLSYDEGAGTNVKNKSTVPRISERTNFLVVNCGVGGDRIVDVNDRFKKNTGFMYSSQGLGIKDVNATYCLIKPNGNEVITALGNNSDLFRKELEDYVQTVLSLGMKPIFASDYFAGGYYGGIVENRAITSIIRDIANKYNAPFHDLGVIGVNFDNLPSIRKWGSHWDTRGNEYYVNEMLHFISRVYGVGHSVKIFRPKSAFTVTTVQDLNYDNIEQRLLRMSEITVGNRSLNETGNQWEYMDKSTQASSYSRAAIYTDEYLELISRRPVSFTSYAIIDFTLKTVKNKSLKLLVYTASNADAHFYLKDYFNPSDYVFPSKGNQSVVVSISKALYDSITVTPGDTYTTDVVKDGSSNNITLVAKGKYYSAETGYIVAMETQGQVSPSVGGTYYTTAGTFARVTGTGSLSIAFDNISPVFSRHSYAFLTGVGKPQGSLKELEANFVTDHYEIVLNEQQCKRYSLYDNLKLFVNIPGAFTITHIEAQYDGGESKKEKRVTYEADRSYTQKIAEPTFNTAGFGAWTWDAGITKDQLPSGDFRDYPKSGLMGTTMNHIALGYDANGVPLTGKRTITVSSKIGYRKAVVYCIAQVFPKYYRTDLSEGTYVTHTRQITPDSYDYGTLCLGIKTENIVNVQRELVGIGWAWKRFEFDVPPLVSSFELSIFRDSKDTKTQYPLWVCYFNLLIEGE